MENATFYTLSKLAEERFSLYLLAGHQHLSPEQAARITEIDNRLPILWDQYRREIAGDGREAKSRMAAERRYSAIDTWAPDERTEREEHNPAA